MFLQGALLSLFLRWLLLTLKGGFVLLAVDVGGVLAM